MCAEWMPSGATLCQTLLYWDSPPAFVYIVNSKCVLCHHQKAHVCSGSYFSNDPVQLHTEQHELRSSLLVIYRLILCGVQVHAATSPLILFQTSHLCRGATSRCRSKLGSAHQNRFRTVLVCSAEVGY